MNAPIDTSLFDRAARFAIRAHGGTERRGKAYPYVLHPMEAALIVSTMTPDPEMLAAALLHDTVEDTPATLDDIRREFGDRVAHLVEGDTGTKPHGTTWHQRKQMQADRLARADRDSKMVALGDKLSNMRAIARDYARIGDDLWAQFKAPDGKAGVGWYYGLLVDALSDLAAEEPYREFTALWRQVFAEPQPSL